MAKQETIDKLRAELREARKTISELKKASENKFDTLQKELKTKFSTSYAKASKEIHKLYLSGEATSEKLAKKTLNILEKTFSVKITRVKPKKKTTRKKKAVAKKAPAKRKTVNKARATKKTPSKTTSTKRKTTAKKKTAAKKRK